LEVNNNVRYGSKADIGAQLDHVRFTPESGHRNRPAYHLRRSNSGSFVTLADAHELFHVRLVRVESLWWMRGLRRLLCSLGTLPLVLERASSIDTSLGLACEFALAMPPFA
jgi:hypothetical protein